MLAWAEVNTAEDIREAAAKMGLSLSGLARAIQASGDTRDLPTIRRWIQAGLEGDRVPNNWLRYVVWNLLRDFQDIRPMVRRQVEMLESGFMHSSSNGRDTTAESLASAKEHLARLDSVLAECDNPSDQLSWGN